MSDLQSIKYRLSLILMVLSISFLDAEILKDSTSLSLNSTNDAYFCDACGCAGSGGSMGFGKVNGGNFVGVRYVYQYYRSKDGIYNNSPWVDEHFNTIQLWANVPINEKVTISAIMPYHFHNRKFADNTVQSLNGIGDASVIAFYNIFKPNVDGFLPEQQKAFKSSLDFGIGVKLPLGAYNRENNEGSVNPGFQVGTGSWDIILAGNYNLTYKSWGSTISANYTIKSENDQQYQFGNQTNYGVNIYRDFSWVSLKTIKPISIIPFAGIAGEIYDKNKNYGELVPNTEGNVHFGKLGMEAGYGKITAGLNYMFPILQHLNNENVKAKSRLGISLNYTL